MIKSLLFTRRPTLAHPARRAGTVATWLVLMLGPVVASCGTNAPDSKFTTSSSAGSGTAGGGQGGQGGIFVSDGFLAVSPVNPTLKLALPVNQTIPFQCLNTGTNEPVKATWRLVSGEIGTIGADTGIFTPNGKKIGEATVECDNGEATAQTKITLFIHTIDDDNSLTEEQRGALRGPTGLSDPSLNVLYPYEQTVFPRGILAPEIHLSQGAAKGDAYYVNIVLPSFEYEGFFKEPAMQMSQPAWDALASVAAGKKVEVRISKLAGGQKYGPIWRQWIIANGQLHGTIFYESYDTQLTSSPGAILRIKGSSPSPEVLLDNCTVCHSIAADGSTAAAAAGTFDLTGGMPNPPQLATSDSSFAALYPKEGSVLIASYLGITEFRTKGGAVIAGSGIEQYAPQSATFSHDGTLLAFWQMQKPHTIGLLNYDAVAQKFSNYQVLTTMPNQTAVTWPAFTPDDKWVILQIGTAAMTQGTGNLVAINVETKELLVLNALNGNDYVPAGARDLNKNYEATVAPSASGGYFWITFTSRRTWGNKLIGDEMTTKRLWISAFDVDPKPGVDPSHPPFYVGGQELNAGNSRGFWAQDPCKPEGAACDTGDECCQGYCNDGLDPQDPNKKLCGPDDGQCSQEYEKCETKADCCDPKLLCIGGKCGQVQPD